MGLPPTCSNVATAPRWALTKTAIDTQSAQSVATHKEEALMTDDHTPDFSKVPTGMLPFPPVEDVFVADQLELADHLHPLFSLDISTVNPAGADMIVMFYEPIEGLVLFTFDYS